jgi:hypothetical protein
MLAIIVVHVVIHWRWIVNMTVGRLRAKRSVKTGEAMSPEKTRLIDRPEVADGPGRSSYISRAGVLIGLVGAISFMMAMVTFQLDWTNKYVFMLWFIPVPFICIVLARKYPVIGGILLVLLSIMSVMLYLIFPIGIVWNQIGVWNELSPETMYTIAFVSLPLAASGALFLISKIVEKRRMKW